MWIPRTDLNRHPVDDKELVGLIPRNWFLKTFRPWALGVVKVHRFYLLFSREWSIKDLDVVARSPFWTPEKPAGNSKQLLCGFFLSSPEGTLITGDAGFV